MFAAHIISFNNGWQVLSQEKPHEWQEIKDVLLEMTPEVIVKPSSYMNGEAEFNEVRDTAASAFLDRLWDALIQRRGWILTEHVRNEEDSVGFLIRNSKNKVYAKLINGLLMDEDIYKLLFVTAPRSYKANLCDVSVALLPTNAVASLYVGTEARFTEYIFNEAGAINIINKAPPINTEAPIVFIFFSPSKEELVIKEMPLVRPDNVIERSIEFAPEYYQAGVGILSYFGKVLRQKHPDINAKVRIEQDGNTVRMRVESPTGEHIDTLEEELTQYALVIQGKIKPESILDNPLDVFELKNKFEMAQLEVRQTRELLQYTRTASEKRITSLEEDVAFLRQTMGNQLLHSNVVVGAMLQQSLSHEKLQSMQITHSQGMFKDLLGEAHGNQVLQNAIRSLEYNLMSGIATIDVQEQVKESLSIMQQNSPNLLARFAAQVESAGYGALAGPVLEWLKQHAQ